MDYIYIDEKKNFGSIAISTKVVVQLVKKALSEVNGVALSEKFISKRYNWTLWKSVRVSYKNGIAHIKVNINLKKGKSIQEVSKLLEEEISNLSISVGWRL